MATFRTDILEKKALCLFLWSENVRNFQIKRKGWHGGFHAFVVLYITVTSRAARRHLSKLWCISKLKMLFRAKKGRLAIYMKTSLYMN